VSDALENVEPERGTEEGRTGDDDPACERDEPGLGVVRHRPLDPADEKSGLKGVEDLCRICGGHVRLEMRSRQVGDDAWPCPDLRAFIEGVDVKNHSDQKRHEKRHPLGPSFVVSADAIHRIVEPDGDIVLECVDVLRRNGPQGLHRGLQLRVRDFGNDIGW
jgi:hypothetical protein